MARGFGATTLPSMDERLRIDRMEKLNGFLLRGHEQLGELRDVGRGLLADEEGRLWRREPGEGPKGREPGVDAFAVAGDLLPLWFRRPERGPTTVAELEALRGRARTKAEREAEERRAEIEARRKNPPARALCLGDHERDLGSATLRELASRFEAAGGVIMIENDGGLTLRCAVPNVNLVRLGRVLSAAQTAILVAVKHKAGPVDPAKLPAAQLTLGGDLLPPKLDGP